MYIIYVYVNFSTNMLVLIRVFCLAILLKMCNKYKYVRDRKKRKFSNERDKILVGEVGGRETKQRTWGGH